MNKRIELCIDDYTFTADMHDDICPKTCKAILQNLPLENDVKHGIWSGPVLFVAYPIDHSFKVPFDIELENPTIYGSKGDILLHIGPLEIGILIVYEKAQFRSRFQPLISTHFASIKGGFNELEEIGKRMRKEGFKKVFIKEKKP
ncbi:DUF3830 family protein [Thermoproteota archaeon]